MIRIRKIEKNEMELINEIVSIHMATFQGFFLTFMGQGFLRQMYRAYCEYSEAEILAAFDDPSNEIVGFLAYSGNMSGLYKYLIKSRLFSFAFYSINAVIRRPKSFIKLLKALWKPKESKRSEKYVRISSIGVKPESKQQGVGTQLISYLKDTVDYNKYNYIMLETDADNNDAVNQFYLKNDFILNQTYFAEKKRKMNEYRYKTVSECKEE